MIVTAEDRSPRASGGLRAPATIAASCSSSTITSTLFEVPLNEARSKAVIDKARTLSTKPLTHAIVSHHHFDHSGGLRVAVAEGLTIITHRDNEAFFKDLRRSNTHHRPDALAEEPAAC